MSIGDPLTVAFAIPLGASSSNIVIALGVRNQLRHSKR
jgi:hypothetical protein